MPKANRNRPERGPAITISLYDTYVFGLVADGLSGPQILSRDEFYALPWGMRRHLATTADPTFHNQAGETSRGTGCVKKHCGHYGL